ncbi:Uncharacterized protein LSUE1_G000091 [Lachnellula suecica]|uniref:Uncharacterized protein n=1 Tax=Lachnellula suecica TaxID=602035 RepID=A0A8T9CM82_9HELO|nr:Uncharacterized protein LSUE1_G000091 [Lachnellula suecica]
MAYGIMGGTRDSHMLTYQTTRRIKCIYFDGESATLMGTGQLDTQMLHIWGNLTGPPRPDRSRFLGDEYARATGLCDWLHNKGLGGPGWGYEGIVRMNAGFEMIWCNFTSPSLRLISHLNVTTPLLPLKNEERTSIEFSEAESETTSEFPLPPSPTRTDKSKSATKIPLIPEDTWAREPFLSSKLWLWLVSGMDHYGSSSDGPGIGEVRVNSVSCGFLSYYSPIFTNQAEFRAKEERKSLNLTVDGYWTGSAKNDSRSDALDALTRRRRKHTLDGITTMDADLMRSSSERVLRDFISPSPQNCSGIDWKLMTGEIIRTYAGPLKVLSKALKAHENLPIGNQTSLKVWVASIRRQMHDILLPFLEYPEDNAGEAIWKRNSKHFKKTYSQCKFQHTRLLDLLDGFDLGQEENDLKWAVEETLAGLCSVLVEVGFSVERLWQMDFNVLPPTAKEGPAFEILKEEFLRWTHGVEELMAWLGWAGEWTGCEKKCAFDERCFVPMWPLLHWGGIPGGSRPYGNRTGHGRPGYGGPGYPNPYGGFPGFPPNRTRNGRGSNWPWIQDETALWSPICVKADYVS